MVEPIQEAFAITQADSDITSADGLASSTQFNTIWSYLVPSGTGLIILPGHTFKCYLWGYVSGAEMVATTQLRISMKDTSNQDRKGIVDAFLYAVCKEFSDRDKIMRLNVPKTIKVYEKQYLIIEATGDGTNYVDLTDGGGNVSYFELAISRVRQPLG